MLAAALVMIAIGLFALWLAAMSWQERHDTLSKVFVGALALFGAVVVTLGMYTASPQAEAEQAALDAARGKCLKQGGSIVYTARRGSAVCAAKGSLTPLK
jgi:pyrimidine deaminase RibD-like protein